MWDITITPLHVGRKEASIMAICTAPTLSTAGASIDIVSFFWDGTNYFGNSSLPFSVPA